MNKLTVFFILIYFFCGVSGQAADVREFDINAHSVSLGYSALALTGDFRASNNPASLGFALPPILIVDSSENSITPEVEPKYRQPLSLSLSQARLAYDQYGYQVMLTVPCFGNLAFKFDQMITQNTIYYRLLFNADGTDVIDSITNQQATVLTYDTQVDSLFALAYGLQLFPRLALGIEAQAIYLKIGEDYAWGFDGDVGVVYQWPDDKGLSAGLVMRHCNAQWQAWHKPYREETGLRKLEGGVNIPLLDWQTTLTAMMTQWIKPDELPKASVGLAYKGFDPLTLRIGWDADHINLGAGFVWQQVRVDYAAVIGNALYDANRITIQIFW